MDSSIASPNARIDGGKVIDVRERSREAKSCQTVANSAGIRDQRICETSESSDISDGPVEMGNGVRFCLVLISVSTHMHDSHFEIRPQQGRKLIANGHTVESHAFGSSAV